MPLSLGERSSHHARSETPTSRCCLRTAGVTRRGGHPAAPFHGCGSPTHSPHHRLVRNGTTSTPATTSMLAARSNDVARSGLDACATSVLGAIFHRRPSGLEVVALLGVLAVIPQARGAPRIASRPVGRGRRIRGPPRALARRSAPASAVTFRNSASTDQPGPRCDRAMKPTGPELATEAWLVVPHKANLSRVTASLLVANPGSRTRARDAPECQHARLVPAVPERRRSRSSTSPR